MSSNLVAKYDLHLHTYWSYDAIEDPENYFKRARELGVKYIAITDHHVLDSRDQVQEIAERYPDVTSILSAELSVTTSLGTADLLCYGFPGQFSDALKEVLNAYHVWQQEAGEAIVKGMQALGHDYTAAQHRDYLESYRPKKTIEIQGYTHVKNGFLRKHFIERGFISDEEGYKELMKQVKTKGSSPPYPGVDDIIPVVKEAGAVAAIAHPFGYFNKDDTARMDQLREECSLDGIECAHRSVPSEYTPLYREYCVKNGLFSVGGSDCHGDEGELENGFGRHGGQDEWLDEFLERLATKEQRS
jgi:predicted metal-dependent phosphoesterase TrpH